MIIKKIKDTEDMSLTEMEKIFYPTGFRKIWRIIKGFFRSLGYSIKNVIRWLPIIWRDREWDQCFLEQMLLFKLKNMRDYFQGGVNVWSAEAPEVANEIQEVIEILERLEKDEYEETIDPKFYDWFSQDREMFVEKVDINGETYSTVNFPEFTEEQEKHRDYVWQEAERRRTEDLEKAYGLIAKNIRKWWD